MRTEDGLKWVEIALLMGYANKDAARATAARYARFRGLGPPELPTVPTQPRECLSCGATFESQGPQNRICDNCKADPAWDTSQDLTVLQ